MPAPTPTPLSRLWDQTAGYRLRYAAAMAALALGQTLTFVVPLLVGLAIDHGLRGEPVESAWLVRWVTTGALADGLWLVGLAVVVLTAAAGLFMWLEGWLAAGAAESIARRLRNTLYDRLQHLTCRHHDTLETGDVVQRCTSDVETMRVFLQTQAVQIVRASVNLLVVVPVMFLLHWPLAIASTVVLPVIVVFSVVFFRRVQSTFLAMDEAEGALTARIQENLTNIRVVRAFARQDFERQKFDVANTEHRERDRRLFAVFAWYWSASEAMVLLQLGLALFVGAWFVATGRVPVGELVTFWLYVGIMVWPVRDMGRTLSELGKALVALRRAGEVLTLPVDEDPADPDTTLLERVSGRVAFRDVWYAAPSGQPVLRGVSFEVEPGQTLAILGPSGSGKSTLVNLLLRFYDPDGGVITIDGYDIARLPRRAARSQVGVVMQEPFLYSRTLRDNIKVGRASAPDREMHRVAQVAAIHGSVQRFEQGYDTVVGERGVTLSGGQRQRVAIARALLQDKPIVVLDDAFSAVDTRTEAAIVEALRQRHGRATTLLIAHRLSTLKHADRVIVLEHGRVTQQGTHDELLAVDGLYRRLWRIQTELEDDLKQELSAV